MKLVIEAPHFQIEAVYKADKELKLDLEKLLISAN